MKLVPTDPPGRSARKAKRFAQDMRALRAQGCTFEAIRMALAAVGVHVSNATVQREVARVSKGPVVVQAVECRQGSGPLASFRALNRFTRLQRPESPRKQTCAGPKRLPKPSPPPRTPIPSSDQGAQNEDRWGGINRVGSVDDYKKSISFKDRRFA